MSKTKVLTQEEIDGLLTPIDAFDSFRKFKNIAAFEVYLLQRNHRPEKPYGIFDKDISICRFFSDKNETILEDIKQKNAQQGQGNITIPNTNITLINYSYCHHCNTVFSFKDITDYYNSPTPDEQYKSRVHQYREDTRVCCAACGAYFLPSLIISDGTPKNEVQFLCRTQTIDAIEKYLFQKNIRVLTRNKHNIVQQNTMKAIKNDVFIKDLEAKPTLITNMVQYTPFNLIMNLIDGKNVEKGDLLFNEWK